jgi:uncharacterized protein (TIGR02145 family)
MTMKKIMFPLAIFFTLSVNAQDFLITFSGTGEASTVDSVRVENLMKDTAITLKGNEALHLLGSSAINSPVEKQSSYIKIYPNPMAESSLIEICIPESGAANISILDITGKLVFQITEYLDNYPQEFQVSGLNNGVYFINVKSNNYHFSGRLISLTRSNGAISIEKVSGSISGTGEKKSGTDYKEINDAVMAYDNGDRLLITGYSGNYTTVTTDVPTASKTITFDFVMCAFGVVSYYPVVKIGDQVWMASNLETSKLNDGADISIAPADTSPGYRYYNDDAYHDYYGLLYNWYAVNTGKLCPTGWRMPSDFDWTVLVVYLEGISVAGGKLKATGPAWEDPNWGATNESGFTALPGGMYSGMYRNLGYAGYWWSGTEIPGGSFAYYRALYNSSANVLQPEYMSRSNYFSVRCIKE